MPGKRSPINRTSFQFKIFLIFTTLIFFITGTYTTLHILDKAHETRSHVRKEVHLLARQLADAIRLPLYAEDIGLLSQLAEKTGRTPEVATVIVTAMDGRVLAGFRPKAASRPTDVISETVEVQSLNVGSSPENGLTGSTERSASPIGTVHVERGTDDLKRAIYRDIGYSGLLALCSWLVASGLSFLVFRRLTRSFATLVRGVKAMQTGDFSTRIPVVATDEPGMVALAINGLAETLQLRQEENLALHQELVRSLETEVRAKKELVAANHALEQENAVRLQAEQSARKSERALIALMDIMPVGVLLINQDESVAYVNEFLVESFGYGRKEIPTLSAWFTLVFPDPGYCREMAATQKGALAQSRSSESADTTHYDARITCKGGDLRQVLFSNQAQGDQTIVVVIDITDREQTQEQAIKVQKLESLGVLAGGIAHNFNNALTGVLGFISLARAMLVASHEAQEYLQYAEKSSLRAAGMAKQLLTFARGGAPVKRLVSLGKLLTETASLTLNGSNVSCEFEMPAFLPLIRADEGQLVQALSNIVINAMQSMPEGGTLAIRAESRMQSCGNPDHNDQLEYVGISISDQGHGIAEENLPKIFDPYFTTRDTSTGLGLASTHSIIYRHGGHISVHSRQGEGTTFTICLPSSKEAQLPNGGPAGRLDKVGGASGSVLVMDDDETVRELAGRILGFLGYQAVVCADGQQAVELYQASREAGPPFLAVILDLTVPGGVGGVEAAGLILALNADAKLIVSSGYSFDPVMAKHRDYGFCGAIVKPYKADELGHELSLLH